MACDSADSKPTIRHHSLAYRHELLKPIRRIKGLLYYHLRVWGLDDFALYVIKVILVIFLFLCRVEIRDK